MVTEDERKLVLARLAQMPPTIKLAIGDKGPLTKEELINHVKEGDALGDMIVKIQLNYLRSITKRYYS